LEDKTAGLHMDESQGMPGFFILKSGSKGHFIRSTSLFLYEVLRGGKNMKNTKRSILFCLIIAFVAASTVVSAQEKAPLGNSNFALKLDYIAFTDSHFSSAGNTYDGFYIGLEGYGKITPNVYLGGEIGTGTNSDIGGEEITFVPFELNVKYATAAARNVVIDLGAGLSYSSVEIQYLPLFGTAQEARSDWLFGGQVFADLTYKINWFSIGVNGKYQITENFKNENIDLNNYRLGVQFGMVF
jgi:hypothetical protein